MQRWDRRALLVCGALLLAACGPVGNSNSNSGGSNAAPSGALKNGGTLTVALADDPDQLDPTLARTLVGRSVFTSICEQLYDIDKGPQRGAAALASMPTVSQDGKTVEIELVGIPEPARRLGEYPHQPSGGPPSG